MRKKTLIIVLVVTALLVPLSYFIYYAYEKVYVIEIPLYRNIFIDEGDDLVTNNYVRLPYEVLLNKFNSDTVIDGKNTCYSTLIFRDKRTDKYEELELMPYVDTEYQGAKVKLISFSESQIGDGLYFLIHIEQRRYEHWMKK